MTPGLHVVTDDVILKQDTFLSRALRVLEAGGPGLALHLRGPRTGGQRLFDLAEALKGPARDSGALLLANDRLDVALCSGLPGAHLGQRSIPPPAARELLGPQRLLGLSVHGPGEVPEPREGELDYLFVGTIFPSASHPGGPVGGMERIGAVAGVTELPLMAIGGISPRGVRDVLAAGAHGVAVLEAVWSAADIGLAVEELLEVLEGERE